MIEPRSYEPRSSNSILVIIISNEFLKLNWGNRNKL